ncbi:hypothetical protein F5Y09DRAFT_354158 [Xylaria sp. FL1042]|nr:hypothetical protein F5Y09DRAFT_354158 [Xylaria sp. FL1042]
MSTTCKQIFIFWHTPNPPGSPPWIARDWLRVQNFGTCKAKIQGTLQRDFTARADKASLESFVRNEFRPAQIACDLIPTRVDATACLAIPYYRYAGNILKVGWVSGVNPETVFNHTWLQSTMHVTVFQLGNSPNHGETVPRARGAVMASARHRMQQKASSKDECLRPNYDSIITDKTEPFLGPFLNPSRVVAAISEYMSLHNCGTGVTQTAIIRMLTAEAH